MAFIQIVEFETSQFDEMRKLAEQFRKDSEGKRTAQDVTMCVDRDNPERYFVIAKFPSYEQAMENSELPETQALAEEMSKLANGPATFHNLDVVESWAD